MRHALLFVPLVVGLALLPACGGDEKSGGDGASSGPSASSSGPVGTWTIDMDALIKVAEEKVRAGAAAGGSDLPADQLDMVVKQATGNLKTIEMRCGFTDDGKCWMEGKMMGKVEPRQTGTWKMEGDKVLITPDPGSDGEGNQPPTMLYKDGKLTVPTGDLDLPLKRI